MDDALCYAILDAVMRQQASHGESKMQSSDGEVETLQQTVKTAYAD